MTICTIQTAMCLWNAKVPQEQRGGLEKKLVCSDSWEMAGLGYSFHTYCFGFSRLCVRYWPYPVQGKLLKVSALLIVEPIYVCSPCGPTSKVSLSLGLEPPAKAASGVRAMAFLAGGLWQGDYFWGFGVVGFHQVVFIAWDLELIILALLSHTYYQYLNGFSWEDFVPSCSQITKVHSVSAGVLAFLFPNLNRVRVKRCCFILGAETMFLSNMF